jgi:hypothetical protein
VWRYRTSAPLTFQPTFHDDVLYCAVPGTGLLAFDGASGKVKWTSTGTVGTVVGSRKGNLLVWDGSRLSLVDRGNGDTLASYAMPGVQHVLTDAFADGNVFVISSSGIIAKFAPRN